MSGEMPLIRALNLKSLIPLGGVWSNLSKNLVAKYQADHPEDRRAIYHPVVAEDKLFHEPRFSYRFYGNIVPPSSDMYAKLRVDPAHDKCEPESVVAVMALEYFIGKEVYGEGEEENARIVAFPAEGFKLSVQGTNVVEAAVILPILRELVLKYSAMTEQGIDWVEAAVACPEENMAMAASPLRVKITVPNLGNFNYGSYYQNVEAAFRKAVRPWLFPLINLPAPPEPANLGYWL